MMKSLITIILSCLASLAVASPTIGEKAPDFSTHSTTEERVALKEFRGKYVVLEWTNYECPFVQKHYNSKNMQNLQKKYTDKGVVWLTIVSSAPGKQGYYRAEQLNKLSMQKGSFSTALLMDPSGKVGRLYSAKTTPHMFVINPEGTLVYQGAIDSIKSTKVADIERSTNYVSQALDAVMNGQAVPVSQTSPYGCAVKY